MKIDMHVHTMVSSPCSMIDPLECVERAIELGLDGICVTEHETIEGGHVTREISRAYKNIKVFAGIEVLCREGHMLVYGYTQDIPGVKPVRDVMDIVTSSGGIVVPAHPWRKPFGWYEGSLDKPIEDTEFPNLFNIIEMYNGQQSVKENEKGEKYCRDLGAFGIGGSDAHILDALGCVVTEFEDDIEDETQLVKAILSGRYTATLNPSYYKFQES